MPSKTIVQFSVVDALVAGLFDGVFAVSEVGAAGSLGLGCGDHMDGELVVLDGVFRLFHGDGTATVLDPVDEVAFAEVADFAAASVAEIEAADFGSFVTAVEKRTPSANLFAAVRFEGHFGAVSLREARRQSKPYLPLAQAVHDQRENVVEDVTGTIVGFLAPGFFQGISVAGAHFHFVDSSGAIGGHVLGVLAAAGTLAVEPYAGITVRLPESPEYLAAVLDAARADADIRHAESDHQS
jgi:acetolactate decarboxylase